MPIVLESVDVYYFIEMYCTVRLYEQLSLFISDFFINNDSSLQLKKPLNMVECTSGNVSSNIPATTVVELPTTNVVELPTTNVVEHTDLACNKKQAADVVS